jgi:sporulation protein YlmC with PRC-barrel domain
MGDVEAVEIDGASGRISRIVVRRGIIFTTETSIPATLIDSVTDRITLRAPSDAVKKLEKR